MKTCPNCGAQADDSVQFCTVCGASMPAVGAYNAQPQAAAAAQYRQPAQQYSYQQPAPAPMPANRMPPSQIPSAYRPLSPWAYFGYSLLFGIPVVGFILLIVFSFSEENINRRNFARSFFIGWFLAIVITVIIIVLTATGVIALGGLGFLDEIFRRF
ncbi:MAG: zinc ribbon domain-containing protein [Clostridia bacterium]|nr:zinc ribbon domain-containing protein [Clostridia bacterium]MBR5428364.1 zinc ribbon domain-containing protein [Clostridia bacterium]